MNNLKEIVSNQLKIYFEEYSKEFAPYAKNLLESMKYTALLEGKKLRALMNLEIASKYGLDINTALPLACAIEIMHSYSLIHDDLPCMDNDDLRRGKPTNHKVFGEATALLAGDALISFGAQLIIEKTPKTVPNEVILDIVKDYLRCAGAFGIIAGQIADIEAENKEIDFDNLKYIHKYKTGALFEFAIVSGAKLAQADKNIIEKLREYAENFGILFQIYDDIIDCTLTTAELGKTAGKDKICNKLTYVSAWGLDKARSIFNDMVNENKKILQELNIESEIFNQIYSILIKKIEGKI